MVSETTPSLFRILETLKQATGRQLLLATMDPVLKDYLDKMCEGLAKSHEETRSDLKAIKTLLQGQTWKLSDLATPTPTTCSTECSHRNTTSSMSALSSAATHTSPSVTIDISLELASTEPLGVEPPRAAVPTSPICSTDGRAHDTGGDDFLAMFPISWGTIQSLNAPQTASLNRPCRFFVILKLDTKAPASSGPTAPSDTIYSDSKGMYSRVELRPLPWPSFEGNQGRTLRVRQVPSLKERSQNLWSVLTYWGILEFTHIILHNPSTSIFDSVLQWELGGHTSMCIAIRIELPVQLTLGHCSLIWTTILAGNKHHLQPKLPWPHPQVTCMRLSLDVAESICCYKSILAFGEPRMCLEYEKFLHWLLDGTIGIISGERTLLLADSFAAYLNIWAEMKCSYAEYTYSLGTDSLDLGGPTQHDTSKLVLNEIAHLLLWLACHSSSEGFSIREKETKCTGSFLRQELAQPCWRVGEQPVGTAFGNFFVCLSELRLARSGIECVALNRIIVNRNHWFLDSNKLKIKRWDSYLVEQCTDKSPCEIETGLRSFCVSTSRALMVFLFEWPLSPFTEFLVGTMIISVAVTCTEKLCSARGVIFSSSGPLNSSSSCEQPHNVESSGATTLTLPVQFQSTYSVGTMCLGFLCDILHSSWNQVARNCIQNGSIVPVAHLHVLKFLSHDNTEPEGMTDKFQQLAELDVCRAMPYELMLYLDRKLDISNSQLADYSNRCSLFWPRSDYHYLLIYPLDMLAFDLHLYQLGISWDPEGLTFMLLYFWRVTSMQSVSSIRYGNRADKETVKPVVRFNIFRCPSREVSEMDGIVDKAGQISHMDNPIYRLAEQPLPFSEHGVDACRLENVQAAIDEYQGGYLFCDYSCDKVHKSWDLGAVTMSDSNLQPSKIILSKVISKQAWGMDDMGSYTCYDQEHFRGRDVIAVPAFFRQGSVDHKYYPDFNQDDADNDYFGAFFDWVPLSHDYYVNDTCFFYLIQVNLSHGYSCDEYHGDFGTTRDLQAPWDPGELFVATAWGQAVFQEERGVSDLPFVRPSDSLSGPRPSPLPAQATHGLQIR